MTTIGVATMPQRAIGQGSGPRTAPLPATGQQQELLRRRMLEQQEVRLPLPIFAKVFGPENSKVAFFTLNGAAVTQASPALVGLRARHRYNFAIEVPGGQPGDRLYGAIEVLRGPCLPRDVKASDVAAPIRFTEADFQAVQAGALVTKFIVVEDAERSIVDYATADEPAQYHTSLDEADAIRMAKELGNITMVARLGTRVPTLGDLAAEATPGSLLVPSAAIGAAGNAAPSTANVAYVYADSGTVTPVGHREAFKAGHTHSFPAAANCMSATGAPCDASASNRCEACFLPAAGPKEDCILGPYVCDGGDRRPKVNFGHDDTLIHLDPEDTVAIYRTPNGPRKIVESNRVCVYSPKFAEIRLLQMPEGYAGRSSAWKLEKDVGPLASRQTVADRAKTQATRPVDMISRKRASVVEGEQWTGNFFEVRVLAGYETGIGWAQEIGVMAANHLRNTDRAVLAKRVEFASLLTNVQMPQLISSVAGASEVYRVRGVMELTRVEERPGKPKVQLEKFASVAAGNIGDKVRFTIKFTNVGKVTVTDVSIVDSLHARLEYVPRSADGPPDAVFSASDNDVGSVTLRWQLKQPLEPGQSGAVAFEARLR